MNILRTSTLATGRSGAIGAIEKTNSGKDLVKTRYQKTTIPVHVLATLIHRTGGRGIRSANTFESALREFDVEMDAPSHTATLVTNLSSRIG